MKKFEKPYKIISVVLSIIICICLAISLFCATTISAAKVYLTSDKFDAQIESMDLVSLKFIHNGEKITLDKYVKDYVSAEIDSYIKNNPLSDYTNFLYPFAGTITDHAVDRFLSSDYVNKVVKTQIHSIVDYFIVEGNVNEAKERIEKGITLETNPELNSDNASSYEEKVNIEVKKAVLQYIETESELTTDQIIILVSFETVDALSTISAVLAFLLVLINLPFAWRSLLYLGISANIYSFMLYVLEHKFSEKFREMNDLVSYQFLKPIMDEYLPYGEKASLYGVIGIVLFIVIIVVINIISKKKEEKKS